VRTNRTFPSAATSRSARSHERLAALPPGLVDDRTQLHMKPSASAPRTRSPRPTPTRSTATKRTPSSSASATSSPRAPASRGTSRQRQVEGLRQLGHLLLHPEDGPGAPVFRRRQVDAVLLRARHAELRRASSTSPAARRVPRQQLLFRDFASRRTTRSSPTSSR
jgi:hypothetical protein